MPSSINPPQLRFAFCPLVCLVNPLALGSDAARAEAVEHRFQIRRNVRLARALLTLVLCMLGVPVALAAREEDAIRTELARYQLDIKPLPLDEALQELARQTGIQIVFFSSITEGHNGPAFSGTYTPAAAMGRLLAGSGLTFREINARTIEVRRPAQRGRAESNASVGAHGSRRAAALALDEPIQDEVEIIATAEHLVATRIPTPLREIPQSISVVSSEQLRQQNQVDVGDVLARAPGIAGRRSNSLEAALFSRAFPISSFHVDGGSALKPYITPTASAFLGSPDFSEFDHLEVLRGSDALFAGNSYPGGTVSLVRKRPLPTPHLDVTAMLGSWNYRRIELDITGPLTSNGALRGRADAVYAKRGYFFDTANLDRKKIFAVLEYDVTPNSTLTAGGSYQWDDARPLLDGWPQYEDDRDSHLPRNLALTTEWAFYRSRFSSGYLEYAARIGDDWRVKLNAGAGGVRAEFLYPEFAGPIDPLTQGLHFVPRAVYSGDPPGIHRQKTAGVTLTGTLHWLGLREEIAIGADFSRFNLDADISSFPRIGPPVGDVRTFDRRAYPDPRLAGRVSSEIHVSTKLEQYGVFASLRAHFDENWSTTLGARVGTDKMREEAIVQPGAIGIPLGWGSSGIFTPFAALMYRINEHYSWYASYADIYLTSGLNQRPDGRLLGPAHGATLETGVKGVWREGLLNGFLALYRVRQRDLPVYVSIPLPPGGDPGSCCYVGGTARSRGAELDLSGELSAGWLVGGGYTYNVNKSEAGDEMDSPTPRHLMKLWMSLRLPGDFDRLTVGGNLRAQSAVRRRNTLLSETSLGSACASAGVKQKPFVVLDLRSGFQVDANWEAALSVNNVLDRTYYESVCGPQSRAWYGEPRNVMLRIDGRF